MVGTRFRKILLMAPDGFPDQLIAGYKYVKHISNTTPIFPVIFDFKPDVIVFDFDYVGDDLEKILRRINFNKFYQNLKICCYKTSPNEKTDSFLKVLGVDQIIYKEDLIKSRKSKSVLNLVGNVLDASILRWAANTANQA